MGYFLEMECLFKRTVDCLRGRGGGGGEGGGWGWALARDGVHLEGWCLFEDLHRSVVVKPC